MLWNLNVKTMPPAFIWSVSFWFIIETHSLFIRTIVVVVANFAVILSGAVVVRSSKSIQKPTFRALVRESPNWKILMGSGLLLDLSLANLLNNESTRWIVKILFLSIFLSSLILWLFVCVVLVPLASQGDRSKNEWNPLTIGINYVRCHKSYLLISLSVLLLGWPIFFVYMFLALPFAQCLTLSSSEVQINLSDSLLETRAHLA